MLKMILKDLRISPLRSVLTSISMLVGIIAMIASFLVGTLGSGYLVAVNAQIYGWAPTYSFSVAGSCFEDSSKLEDLFLSLERVEDHTAITFSMREDVRFAPVTSISSLQNLDMAVYKELLPVDVVFTTSPYNQIYNLPMSSGEWLNGSGSNYSLEIVINKAAKSYFNAPYAVGNVGSSLALTPFHIIGIVNDGRDVATVYIDAYSVAQYVPTMWQVQNATIYWNSTHGLTTEQIYSALSDCIADTVGGELEYSGRSDVGNTYDSVLSMLQIGLLVTSLLLLFVSILGQINIGLSSLEQRTHELLIRRAIGASRSNIVLLVLGSQLILSAFVCVVSILISILLVQGIGMYLPADSPVPSPDYPILVAIISVVASVATALLGGLLPALKAAKLEPALALR